MDVLTFMVSGQNRHQDDQVSILTIRRIGGHSSCVRSTLHMTENEHEIFP